MTLLPLWNTIFPRPAFEMLSKGVVNHESLSQPRHKRGEIWDQRGDGTKQKMKFAFSMKKQGCNSRLVDKSSGIKRVWTLLRQSHRLLKHLLAGKTSRLIAELKTIYKMAPFLEAQVKENSCSARENLSFFLCFVEVSPQRSWHISWWRCYLK